MVIHRPAGPVVNGKNSHLTITSRPPALPRRRGIRRGIFAAASAAGPIDILALNRAPVLADRNQTGLVFGQDSGTGAGLGTPQTFQHRNVIKLLSANPRINGRPTPVSRDNSDESAKKFYLDIQ
jgi:hypothetical protein